MIATIEGIIKIKKENFLILENNGLGYKIFVSLNLLLDCKQGAQLKLFTHQHVREDALQLFGFKTWEEVELFEKLISISGVGPKTGLNVFSIASVVDIKSAIVNEDPSILKKVSGIGAKTAERIVLELKNKISILVGQAGIKTAEELNVDSDVIDALVSLGYSSRQAQEALRNIDAKQKNSSEIIKETLKNLTK